MPLVELIDVTRRFGTLLALDHVSLTLAAGSIHGLLGENGAGKSTAMNVLYGLVRPDSGRILIDGRPVEMRSPRDAIAVGVGMVHQHFMLAGALSVVDNVLLGDRRAGRVLDRGAAAEKLSELSNRLGLPVNPRARVEDLSVGQQQRVEILKALFREARVLILDEPTAVLTPQEADQLLMAMGRLRDEGRAVVFISHKLREVQRICDAATILRRGQVVWRGDPRSVPPGDLARHMVGRDVAEVRIQAGSDALTSDSDPPTSPLPRPPILEINHVSTPGSPALHDISLTLGPEIFGVAGVDGNGQQELAEVVVGLRRVGGGRVLIAGRDATNFGVRQRAGIGVAHIPNDRKREGLVPSMTIPENIALKHHRGRPFSGGGVISWRATRQLAGELAKRFDVRAASLDAPVAALSGGNQQKVVLARELAVVPPRLLVAMNPARGLDIAATNLVYEQLLELRRSGCAVLLISSELDELLRLADRIGVLYRGRLTMTEFPKDDVRRIGRLMAGVES
jgi:simple sugar transport system ATP-binding protein